jgi:hypothetical protein
MVLKATLSSRAPSGRRSSASRMLTLFQCSSIAMIFTLPSFRSSAAGLGRYQRTAWPR